MYSTRKIQIAIAEDNSISLQALLKRLDSCANVHVKHIAQNGAELLNQLRKNSNVDLILMDLEMPKMDGATTTKKVKQHYPHIRVLILTMFDDDEHLFQAIMAGASGYLLKEDGVNKIQEAIQDTLEGGAAISPTIALKTLKIIRQSGFNKGGNVDFQLTTREIEILTQLKNGLTYDAIALNLHISYHTVRKHIENIYRKLHVNNKVEAINKSIENGLTD
jgi:DNA-binding NarL/FixJ family response regulator